MRKITQTTLGEPGVLHLVEVDPPTPGPGEVLIATAAAGVNPVDAVLRAGAMQPRDRAGAAAIVFGAAFLGEPPFTVGWDVAGTVESVGPGVSAFAPGDEVLGLIAFPAPAAAYADRVVASANELVRKPPALSMEQAGALPLAGLTAWQALVGIAAVQPGQRVLIHAAAGGVGHLAVQIAATRGATVIGTASGAKRAFVERCGADDVVDYRAADFSTAVEPVDVVLDLIGGEYAERSARVLVPGGLLITAVGFNPGITAGRAAELGIRWADVSVRPSAHDLGQLVGLVDTGRLTVHVDHAVPLAEAPKAHELLADGHVTGKIVLVP